MKAAKPKIVKLAQAVKRAEKAVVAGSGKYVQPRRGPNMPRVGGKGGFWSDLWGGVKDAVKFAPTAVSTFKSIAPLLTGFGEYKVKNNSFLNNQSNVESGFPTNQAPQFATSGVGSDITFSHREFVTDINSTVGFSVNNYVLNPGNPTLFPWLSQIASLYEEYQFLGVVLEFKSTSATAVGTTSSAMGAVIMATDYDCEDASFTNKRAMESAEYATSGQPFESFIHPIECDPKRNPIPRLYVVPGLTSVAQAPGDPRFSIHGVTTLATTGQQTAGTAIGELWISYHVRLSRPILESAVNPANFTQHIWGTSGTTGTSTIVQQSVVGSGFTSALSGTGNSQFLTLTVPVNSPLIGGSFLVAITAATSTSAAWTAPASTLTTFSAAPGTTTTLPSRAYSPATGNVNSVSLASSTTAQTAGTFSLTNTYSGSCIASFAASGDGLRIYMPTSTAVASFWDVYIAPYNTSLAAPAERSYASTGVSRAEFDALVSRLKMMEEPTASAAARPATAPVEDDEYYAPASSSCVTQEQIMAAISMSKSTKGR